MFTVRRKTRKLSKIRKTYAKNVGLDRYAYVNVCADRFIFVVEDRFIFVAEIRTACECLGRVDDDDF